MVFAAFGLPGQPVDLLKHYPTELTKGDPKQDRARPWEFTATDIFRVTGFHLAVGKDFVIEMARLSWASDTGGRRSLGGDSPRRRILSVEAQQFSATYLGLGQISQGGDSVWTGGIEDRRSRSSRNSHHKRRGSFDQSKTQKPPCSGLGPLRHS